MSLKSTELLTENQLKGIKKAVDAGITVKVNTVVPEVNKDHIEAIAEKMGEFGVSVYKIKRLGGMLSF